MRNELTEAEQEAISQILRRRANEIASFTWDNKVDRDKVPGSVELALSREVERLRRLADAVNPPLPDPDDT